MLVGSAFGVLMLTFIRSFDEGLLRYVGRERSPIRKMKLGRSHSLKKYASYLDSGWKTRNDAGGK